MDDVWDTDIWNNIKFALPEGGDYGNRVVLTTRKNNVASAPHFDSHGYLHKMEPLSFEESWSLFCKRTFDEDQCCPAHLKNVCESILGKCEGLPLAIVAVSGFLALKDKNNLNEWEMVRRGLGAELEGSGKLDRIKNILSLSYNELPYYLRTCLLYLSIFPEDYPIPCWSLTSLWVAERFVQSKGGMILEEVAQEYLKELINRSLIQVTDECEDGLPLKCRIHDLLREILVSKSRELNIMTISNTAGTSSRCPESDEKVRRLVIHSFVADGNSSLLQLHGECNCFKHLRCLITLGSIESSLSKSYIEKILCRGGSRRLLKILDLRNSQLDEIPDEVFNLIHLRCLCLRSTRIEVVPKAIGKLENLEILDLAETRVSELPKDILKLQKLRQLLAFNRAGYTKDYMVGGIKAPYRIGGLQSLLCLYIIDADSDNTVVREIGKLTKLRMLGITNLRREDGRELCSSLEKLKSLIGLEVSSIHRDEVIDLDQCASSSLSSSLRFLRRLFLWGRLEKLPQWIPSLRGLTRVKLCWSEMEDDPLESFEHLPNLSGLYLTQAYRGEGLHFRAGGFLKLKRLSLRKSRGMKWVRVEEGAMPNLQALRLTDLKLMEELPGGIQHLTKLRLVSLNNMSGNLIDKLVRGDGDEGISQERKKIAHVPQVKIANYINTDNKWQVCYL